jgi:hypothetical protein
MDSIRKFIRERLDSDGLIQKVERLRKKGRQDQVANVEIFNTRGGGV